MNSKNKKGAATAVTVISLIAWTAFPLYVGLSIFILKKFSLIAALPAFFLTLLLMLIGGAGGSFFAPVFLAAMQKSRKTEWVYIIASLFNVASTTYWAFYASSLHISDNAVTGFLGSPEFWAEAGNFLISSILGVLLITSVFYLLISLIQLLLYRGIYGYEFKLQRKPGALSIIVFSALSAASLAGTVIRFITVLPEKPTVNEALATFAVAGAVLATVITIVVWFFINKRPLALQLAIISPIQAASAALCAFVFAPYDSFFLTAAPTLPILAILVSYFVSFITSRKKA